MNVLILFHSHMINMTETKFTAVDRMRTCRFYMRTHPAFACTEVGTHGFNIGAVSLLLDELKLRLMRSLLYIWSRSSQAKKKKRKENRCRVRSFGRIRLLWIWIEQAKQLELVVLNRTANIEVSCS